MQKTRNIAGKVDNVEYWRGATLVNEQWGDRKWGLILSSYINSKNLIVDEAMFRHEYGHTRQSKLHGPLYITHVGVPSFIGSILDELRLHNHDNEWTEIQANKMSYTYLMKRVPESLNDKLGGQSWSNEYRLSYVVDWYFAMFPPSYLFLLNF